MKETYQHIFQIINNSIHNFDYQLPDNVDCDWTQIYTLLQKGKLLGITFPLINKQSIDKQPPSELMDQWKNYVFQHGLLHVMELQELKYVLSEAKKYNIQLITFKGISLEELYPFPNMRFSCDADLLVSSQQREEAENLLVNLGYSYVPGSSKKYVPVYKINNGNRRLSIELHERLWEDYEGEQMELLDSLQFTDTNKLIQQNACGIDLVTLGHEDHLIYQIFHMAKHFSLEGLCLRYLTDITLYINSNFEKIDFKHFWYIMKELKYDIFCDSLFKICVEYLNLNMQVLNSDYINLPLNERLITDIIFAGKIGDINTDAWLATDYLAPFFVRKNKISHSKTKNKLAIFFPTSKELKDKFSYAKKCPVLLPIAWIHRYFSGIHYFCLCKIKGISATKVLSKAEYRLSLMYEVGLVDRKS